MCVYQEEHAGACQRVCHEGVYMYMFIDLFVYVCVFVCVHVCVCVYVGGGMRAYIFCQPPAGGVVSLLHDLANAPPSASQS
jgi:hypothetical protein